MNSKDVQLFRIDDRLIHGQVVLGWAQKIGTKRIILCDEEIAGNEWERELYMSCVPEGMETLVINFHPFISTISGKVYTGRTGCNYSFR